MTCLRVKTNKTQLQRIKNHQFDHVKSHFVEINAKTQIFALNRGIRHGPSLRFRKKPISSPIWRYSIILGASSRYKNKYLVRGKIFSSGNMTQATLQELLVGTLVVDFAIQFVGWVVASALKTEKFYDALGSVAYLTVAIGSLAVGNTFFTRQILMTCLVVAWTVRLGTFLIIRVKRTGGDSRFEEMKYQPLKFFVAWFLQGVWVWVVCLPLVILNGTLNDSPFLWSDAVGVFLWAVGFATETVADWQKFHFKMNPENRGKFVDIGLWKYARYPNYFGEITLWCGIFLGCCAVFDGAKWAAIISPIFVSFLLLFVSGIPMQEQQAQDRWGQDPAYQEYRDKTFLLLPLPMFWRQNV